MEEERPAAKTKAKRKTTASCDSSHVYYGEPWEARPGSVSGRIASIDVETGEVVETPPRESDRPWLVWAHVCPELAGETMSWLSPGEVLVSPDTWPIITFRPSHARKTSQEITAKRVAACVNFCVGIDLDAVGYPTLKELLASMDDSASVSRRELNSFWSLKTQENESKEATTIPT